MVNKGHWSSTNIQRVFCTVIHLGEADGEDGVGAAAEVIHACAGCGAVGIAENDQVLHVIVVVNQVLGEICT